MWSLLLLWNVDDDDGCLLFIMRISRFKADRAELLIASDDHGFLG